MVLNIYNFLMLWWKRSSLSINKRFRKLQLYLSTCINGYWRIINWARKEDEPKKCSKKFQRLGEKTPIWISKYVMRISGLIGHFFVRENLENPWRYSTIVSWMWKAAREKRFSRLNVRARGSDGDVKVISGAIKPIKKDGRLASLGPGTRSRTCLDGALLAVIGRAMGTGHLHSGHSDSFHLQVARVEECWNRRWSHINSNRNNSSRSRRNEGD